MRMIFGAIGGMKIGRGNRSTRRNPTPASLCLPQNPTWQARSRTPDRSGGKTTTNRLIYDAAFLVPFNRLLRLAGSRWRYSTPPPHGLSRVDEQILNSRERLSSVKLLIKHKFCGHLLLRSTIIEGQKPVVNIQARPHYCLTWGHCAFRRNKFCVSCPW
jgi:hypothetical protein